MPKNAYYIYALKDPRGSTAKPFYIGKGTGVRAWEHLLRVDNTRKGMRIAEIVKDGLTVVVTKLADDLTEIQALKLEAEMISALGTEDNGGMLTNSVTPTGNTNSRKLRELAHANPSGVTNSEVVRALGLQSDYAGGSKDYLSWSILGLLMRDGKMARVDNKRHIAQVR